MRTLWTAVAAVALVLGVLPTAGANDLKGPGPGYIATDNIEWLGNIPVNTDSAGGRLLDGYFYISDDRGLTIYDTKDPANPQRVGFALVPQVRTTSRKTSTPTARSHSSVRTVTYRPPTTVRSTA